MTAPTSSSAPSGAYTSEAVEVLLSHYWRDWREQDYQNPNPPDPQMPKAKSSPATGGTFPASMTDVDRAWNKSGLTEREKVALLLRYGFDRGQQDIATQLGIGQGTVSRRITAGVVKMTGFLNGQAND